MPLYRALLCFTHIDCTETSERTPLVPQRIRASIERRSNRLKLPIAPTPSFVTIAPGIYLGYRRCAGPGRWIVRVPTARAQRGNARLPLPMITKAGQRRDHPRLRRRHRQGPVARPRPGRRGWQARYPTRGGGRLCARPCRARRPCWQRPAPAPSSDRGAIEPSRRVADLARAPRLARLPAHGMAAATVNRTTLVLKAALNAAASHDWKL